jgi:hypothetical protein
MATLLFGGAEGVLAQGPIRPSEMDALSNEGGSLAF